MDGILAFWTPIDWKATGQLCTTLIAVAAFILSILNHVRTRKRISVQIAVVPITSEYGEIKNSVQIRNSGNHPLTIRRVRLVMLDCPWKVNAATLYDRASCEGEQLSLLSPEDTQGLIYDGSGWMLFDQVEVTLTDESVHTLTINPDARHFRDWFDVVTAYLGAMEVTWRTFPVFKQMLCSSDHPSGGLDWDLLEPISQKHQLILDAEEVHAFGVYDRFRKWVQSAPLVLEHVPGVIGDDEGNSYDADGVGWTDLAYRAASDPRKLSQLKRSIEESAAARSLEQGLSTPVAVRAFENAR